MAEGIEPTPRGGAAAQPVLRRGSSRGRPPRRTRAQSGRPSGRRECGGLPTGRRRALREATRPSTRRRRRARCREHRVPRHRHDEVVERETDGEREQRPPAEACSHVIATNVRPRFTIRTGPGKSARSSPGPSRWFSFAHERPARSYARCAVRSGSQWTSGRRVCTLDREPSVRRRQEDVTTHAQRLGDEGALALLAADMLGARRWRTRSRRRRPERQRAGVSLDVGDVRVGVAKPGTVVEPERGDAVRPRVQLLEEVVRAASRLAPGAPKPISSTPTSSTVVSAVGRMASRKSRSLRLRERSETASTTRMRCDGSGRSGGVGAEVPAFRRAPKCRSPSRTSGAA